jgi:hypothetical protein
MTVRVWSWRAAIEGAALPPMTKLVLYTLANHMNEHGRGAYPSVPRIAAACGLKERAVYNHIKAAEKAGFLKRGKLGKAGQKWASNEYEASYPPEVHHDASQQVHDGAGLHQRAGQGVHGDAGKGCTGVHTNSPVNSPEIAADDAEARDVQTIVKATELTNWICQRFGNRQLYISAPVIAWLKAGADPEADIKPVIERHIASNRQPPRTSLAMFDNDVAESIRQRTKPLNLEDTHAGKRAAGRSSLPHAGFSNVDYRAGAEESGFLVV